MVLIESVDLLVRPVGNLTDPSPQIRVTVASGGIGKVVVRDVQKFQQDLVQTRIVPIKEFTQRSAVVCAGLVRHPGEVDDAGD